MDRYFREMFEATRDTAVALVEASQANARAGEALKRLAEAALTAKDEHEDLRETVDRLEHTVLDLVKEVHDLRAGRPPE